MKRDIDLLHAYKITHDRNDKQNFSHLNKKLALIVGGNLLVAVLLVGGFSIYHHSLSARQQELDSYVNESAQAKEYHHILDIQEHYNNLRLYNDMVDKAAGVISDRPMLEEDDYQVLQQSFSSGMHIVKLQMEGDSLTATIGCSSGAVVPDYVDRVKKSGSFQNVSYNGWGSVLLAQAAEYRFDIRCQLHQQEDPQ